MVVGGERERGPGVIVRLLSRFSYPNKPDLGGMFPLLPLLVLAMVVGFEVRGEAHGLRSHGSRSNLSFPYPMELFSHGLNYSC
jgi:hypothetical protein